MKKTNQDNTIALERLDCAPGFIIRRIEDGESILVQTDWDYPSTAETFGWNKCSFQVDENIRCEHSETDGTIDCPDCPATASDFICAAANWLYDNEGAESDDPGYFDNL